MERRLSPLYRRTRLALAVCVLVATLNLPLHAATTPDFTQWQVAQGALNLQWASLGENTNFVIQARASANPSIWLGTDTPWPITANSWAITLGNEAPAQQFYRVMAVPKAERGKLLASTPITTVSAFLINLLLAQQGVTTVNAQYNVDVVKLTYETVGAWGERTIASGVVAVPSAPGKSLPILSYQHGTLSAKTEAPSANLQGETLIAAAFASTGYLGVVADYIGLGDSPGFHPYHHARSSATACVDMTRAARAYCANRGTSLNGQVFLAGYSEGGFVTMAFLKELEQYHTNEFTVTAAAPMAGAYDLSGVTSEDLLSGRVMPNPYYFAYTLYAYQSVYHVANSFADMLAPPYNTTVPPKFNPDFNSSEVNALLPGQVTFALNPNFLQAFKTDPNHPLRQALHDNDLYRWTPKSKLRLYHCSGDHDVVPANSQVAYQSFLARGATQVEFVDKLPGAGHGDCVLPSLLDAKAWFDTLRH